MNSDTLTNYFKPILYKFHDREALVFKTGFRSIRISYLDLYDYAYRMANWYQRHGLKKDDAILLWAPNSPEWVAALLACSLTGVIAVPLDARVKPDFVRHIAAETGAKAGIKSKFMSIESGITWWNTGDLSRQVREIPPIFKEPEIAGDDILEIVYTSGTTAEPKGVILTNKNIVSNIASLSEVLSYDTDWKFLSVLPLSHMLEQNAGLFIPLFYGCSITYLRTRKSAAIMQAMQEEGITSVITVPLMLQTFRDGILREVESRGMTRSFERMLGLAWRLPRGLRKILFRSAHKKFGNRLAFFAVGGAPLDGEVEDFWNNLGLKVVQGYGLTETSPIVTCNTVADPRPGTVGRVLPGQEIKLSSEGEILVRGDNVTQGYYKRPDLQEMYFTDGWYRTGDVGETDSEGYLCIKGRIKNMILTASGMNVYPEDIEAELNRTPGVKESCVLGREQEGKTVIHAVLLLSEDASDGKAIVATANANLADHQKVQAYTVWDKPDFPRTTTMKIQRRFVLEALEANHGVATEATAPVENGDPIYGIIRSISNVPANRVTPTATLGLDLQLDSLSRVELVGIIEEELRVELDESLITDRTTVGELEEFVASQRKTSDTKYKLWPLTRWAVCIRRLLQAVCIRPVMRYYMKLRIMGREKFDGLDKPFILIANHISHLDAGVLTMALPWRVRKRMAVAAAADVFQEWDSGQAPLKERIFRKSASFLALLGLNIFPFQRYAGIKKSLEYTGKLMDRGWSIMIFPEGKLSQDGTVKEFKAGVGLLVKELDAVVVPSKIQGVFEIMDYRFTWPRKHGDVTVRFGNPVLFPSDATYEEIAERLEHEVRFL
ncbi:MAG: AMP-binding protein [Acidobacteria bacterium]|nr:AMP-binding protein [Acidobacteriota bacterium]